MFVSFEGIDGSGKSTQLTLLRTWIEEKGIRSVTVREPGATVLSESIRDIVLSNKQSITPTAELLLFSAARAQLVENIIIPALDRGEVVLCDRYVDSTTAYQGHGRMLDMEQVRICNSLATHGVLPTLTFFIDVAYEEAQQRMHFTPAHEDPDRMEKSGREFYERVRAGYHAIAEQEADRFRIVDGMRDPEAIHTDILRIFEFYV